MIKDDAGKGANKHLGGSRANFYFFSWGCSVLVGGGRMGLIVQWVTFLRRLRTSLCQRVGSGGIFGAILKGIEINADKERKNTRDPNLGISLSG